MAIRLRRQFVLRKLHQLTGFLPLGAFLLEHFYTNSYAALGPEAFNQAVATLQGLPYLLGIETLFIFLPLLFHGVYGLWITWQGQPNQFQYPYVRNWMYTLQRVTGLILIIYVAVHVSSQRFGIQILNFNPMGKAVAHHPNDLFPMAVRICLSTSARSFTDYLHPASPSKRRGMGIDSGSQMKRADRISKPFQTGRQARAFADSVYVIADFNFNGELTMREKKHDDRSSAEMPKAWRSSSMTNEEASGAGDGQTELRNQIARRAYEIYEERGRCDGDDINDWLQAEVEVKSSLMGARLRPVASRART